MTPVLHLHLKGRCPECGRVYLLTEQGMIPTHYTTDTGAWTCPGSKARPEPLLRTERDDVPDYGGAWDGNRVISDADPGL